MKKIFVLTMVLFLMVSGTAFAQGYGFNKGTSAKSAADAAAQAQINQNFEASNIPVQMPGYPVVPGPMIQQNNAPSGKDVHWNRVIKPWMLQSCWTKKDLDRLENNFALFYPTVSDKGTIQIFPFADLKGGINAFTVVPVVKKEEADKMYKLVAAASIFAGDSETSYMQQWVKILKANMKTIGAQYVMVIHEGQKEGSEAFGWHLGLSIGAQALNHGGNNGVGATIGAGVSNTQTKAEEYPNLTVLFFDKK